VADLAATLTTALIAGDFEKLVTVNMFAIPEKVLYIDRNISIVVR
jgi:hypothetical protein